MSDRSDDSFQLYDLRVEAQPIWRVREAWFCQELYFYFT